MKKQKRYFVTGIGTGIGKTICSAILVEHLNADYWKPIQAGDLNETDTDKVKSLVTNQISFFHNERYKLLHAMSPHAAAKLEGINIELSDFTLPETNNHLIIEGAGGLLVPINSKGDNIADLIAHLKAEIIVVSQNYLGSINHTLLTLSEIKQRKLPLKGIIFNGVPNSESEEIIVKNSGVFVLGRVNVVDEINSHFIKNQNITI